MGTGGSFFFLLWCLKGFMRLAKGFGKKGSKICCFGKRFEARLQLFFLAPEEHGEESLWPEK